MKKPIVGKINYNMRCIEIFSLQETGGEAVTINYNMRCIEIFFLVAYRNDVALINYNMRCIEMVIEFEPSDVLRR